MYSVERYQRPESVDQAIEMLQAAPEAQILAGGTDILIKLRQNMVQTHLVDVSALPELLAEGLEPDGTVVLGAGMTFARVAASHLVKSYVPLLAQAALSVAGPQIRNMGTLGGNLCNGAVSADMAAPLLVLEAQLRLVGPEGTRQIPLLGFHTGPGKVALKAGEILQAIALASPGYSNAGMAWYKYATRAAMDIATIGCAALVRGRGNKVEELRLAYSVAGPVPLRCAHAEAAARGKALNVAMLETLAEAVEQDVQPRSSWRAQKDFRLHIIKMLAKKMTVAAAAHAGMVVAGLEQGAEQ